MIDVGAIRAALAAVPSALRPLSSGLDHIGVAVSSLDESLPLYRDLLGLKLLYEEEVASDGVRVAVLELGGGHLELLEPTAADTPVGRFLAKRGPGIHHVALRVRDCAAALAAVRAAGLASRLDAIVASLHARSVPAAGRHAHEPGILAVHPRRHLDRRFR